MLGVIICAAVMTSLQKVEGNDVYSLMRERPIVSSIGDLDEDGVGEAVFCNARGSAYIISSSRGSTIAVVTREKSARADPSSYGHVARAITDLDGDGRSEVVISGRGYAEAVDPLTGEVFYRVGDAAELPAFGYAVEVTDDLNGDGIKDLAVSAPSEGSAPGKICVLSGGDGTKIATIFEQAGSGEAGQHWFGTCLRWSRSTRQLIVVAVPDVRRVAAALGGRLGTTRSGATAYVEAISMGSSGTELSRVRHYDTDHLGRRFGATAECIQLQSESHLVLGSLDGGASTLGLPSMELAHFQRISNKTDGSFLSGRAYDARGTIMIAVGANDNMFDCPNAAIVKGGVRLLRWEHEPRKWRVTATYDPGAFVDQCPLGVDVDTMRRGSDVIGVYAGIPRLGVVRALDDQLREKWEWQEPRVKSRAK